MADLLEESKKYLKQKNSYKPESKNRYEKFRLRYEMLNDNYKSQVVRHLANIYTKANEVGLDRQIDLTNNIYKTIVYKISRVYNFGVNREFSSEDTELMYKVNRIDKILKQANRYLNAFNDLLLQVSWDFENDKPRLIFRYPHKTRVSLDDNDNPKEVEYLVSIEDKKEKWAYWTKEDHYYKIYDGETFIIEYPDGNENGINPYQELPFVFMQNGFRDGFFFDQYTGDDLIYITLDNAVYNTFKNYLIKWQTFKQLWVTGSNIGAIQGQMLDPSTAITVNGEDAKLGLLDLTANLEQLENTLMNSANNVALNYNISPSQFRMTSQVSSGFALQMENTALDNFTISQQYDFVDYEKELFRLMSVVSEKDLGTMDITFNKPTYKESRQTEIETIAKEIELGIKSPIKVIQERNNISEDDAKEIFEQNLKERNQLNEKFNKQAPTVDINLDDGV